MLGNASLERFERSVDDRDYSAALSELFNILHAIDSSYGRLDGVRFACGVKDATPPQADVHFASRFIAAFGQLFLSPGFDVAFLQFERLQQYNRWIELMSSLSGFGSTDHFVRRLGPEGDTLDIAAKDILHLLALYMPHPSTEIPFDVLHHGNDVGFVLTALGWIGSRYCFNRPFFELRERLLEWIVPKLEQIKLGEIPLANVAESYFHCSYAFTPRKHDIKRALTKQMRRALLEVGAVEWRRESDEKPLYMNGKPILVVTTEYIAKGHSVYRTHSKALRSLRARFHVVLICRKNQLNEIDNLYDELLLFPENVGFFDGVVELSKRICALQPCAVFHVGVGMLSQVIALASLRLAPIQLVSFGHCSSTMSPVIDYVILPADFVADATTYSEKVISLPREAMPYEPRTDVDYEVLKMNRQRGQNDFVKIAVPGTLMKLNPVFFEVLAKIETSVTSRCEFHFFPGFCVGMPHTELERQIKMNLSNVVVNAELPYAVYCRELANCDFSLNPFPYGNMNTIVEGVALGLPGISLDGPESHSHADGALYSRFGLPSCLNTSSTDSYIRQAVRMVDDANWRENCREAARNAPISECLYKGDGAPFCNAVYDTISKHYAVPIGDKA